MNEFLPENQTRFFGVITAETTHELNNVLAIIRESAGLIQDIIRLSGSHSFTRRNTVVDCLDAIERNIQRGTDLLGCLNQFAHSPEQDSVDLDPRNIIERMIRLCNRSCRRKGVDIQLSDIDPGLTLKTDPFLFQMLIYTAFRVCLDTLEGPGEIRIDFFNDRDSWSIRFYPGFQTDNQPFEKSAINDTLNWKALVSLSERLNCRAEFSAKTEGIHLHLPAFPQPLSVT